MLARRTYCKIKLFAYVESNIEIPDYSCTNITYVICVFRRKYKTNSYGIEKKNIYAIIVMCSFFVIENITKTLIYYTYQGFLKFYSFFESIINLTFHFPCMIFVGGMNG